MLQMGIKAKRLQGLNVVLEGARTSGGVERVFNALASGAIQNQAEGMMIGMEAYENTLNSLLEANPNATLQEKEHYELLASQAADAVLTQNRLMIATDAFGLAGLYNGKQMVENLINQPGWRNRLTQFGKNSIALN